MLLTLSKSWFKVRSIQKKNTLIAINKWFKYLICRMKRMLYFRVNLYLFLMKRVNFIGYFNL